VFASAWCIINILTSSKRIRYIVKLCTSYKLSILRNLRIFVWQAKGVLLMKRLENDLPSFRVLFSFILFLISAFVVQSPCVQSTKRGSLVPRVWPQKFSILMTHSADVRPWYLIGTFTREWNKKGSNMR